MDARIDANDASMAEAILKAMNNRELTSGKNGTRVRKAIRNGSHWSLSGKIKTTSDVWSKRALAHQR